MTTTEQHELDAWIPKHAKGYPNDHIELNVLCLRILGWKNIRPASKFGPVMEGIFVGGAIYFNCPFIHRDPAAAMDVLKKCVDKLEDMGGFLAIEKYSEMDGFQGISVRALFSRSNQNTFSEVAKTLELAIALFARKLFSK